MPDEVLTIKEVAALLKLAEKTVYAMAQAGEIPAFKIRASGASSAPNSTSGSTRSRAVGTGATMAEHEEWAISSLSESPPSSESTTPPRSPDIQEENNRC